MTSFSSISVTTTAANGEPLAVQDNLCFRRGEANGAGITIYPEQTRQKLYGIGTSFTQASAFVLAHLAPVERHKVMRRIFSEDGANFAMARTPIGSCDFSVNGKYSYADQPDELLHNFSIDVDQAGFNRQNHPGIVDERYDLLPMIQEALAVKAGQSDQALRIIASAWTAPPWLKDINDWYQGATADNQYQGTGGKLKPQYEGIYAEYLVKYLNAYRREGVNIWGLTPVNEPNGNNGQWESMHFSAESQRDFIRDHLGPALQQNQCDAVKLLMFDHNRDELVHWADVIYSDPQCAAYLSGAAIHWYESSYKVFEEELDKVQQKYPQYTLIHTEGCIDDLGNDAPAGVLDPAGYKEHGWFANDDFWWHANASDWAYSVTWPGVNADDHPLYTPVHRYARNILLSFNHWVSGWIDWNIVLDRRGGPNHVGNYCGAPIMIDCANAQVYYTPIYYILAQLSRHIRPGDVVLANRCDLNADSAQHITACATQAADGNTISLHVLNTSQNPITYSVQIGDYQTEVTIKANALQSIRMHWPPLSGGDDTGSCH